MIGLGLRLTDNFNLALTAQEKVVWTWTKDKAKDDRFLRKLVNFQEVYEKVNFVGMELRKEGLFNRDALLNSSIPCKSDMISEEIRKKGNVQFQKKKFEEALISYNTSIGFAQKDSVNIAIGYANRSATLQKLGLYKEALKNIEMAKKFEGLTEEIIKKLDMRNKECINALALQQKKQVEQKIIFNLSYKSDAKIPFMIDGLEYREAANNRIEIFTKRDLKVGDVVCISPSISIVTNSTEIWINCQNCFQRNPYILIPCNGCVSTMYCSEECRDVAFNSHHKYECKSHEIISENFCASFHGALKLSLIGMSLFDNIEKLLEYCQKKCSKTEFQIKDLYKSAFNFPVFQENYYIDIFTLAQVSLMIKLISNELKFENKNGINLFTNLLYHHMRNSYHNWMAVFPVMFLANPISLNFRHSCAPNVASVLNTKNELNYVVTKCIKANNPLLNAIYCPPFNYMKTSKRQSNIKDVTGGKCTCEACVNDWKLASEYDMKGDLPFQGIEIMNIDKTFFHLYPKLCHFLTQQTKEYPSFRTLFVEMIIIEQMMQTYDVINTFSLKRFSKCVVDGRYILFLFKLFQEMNFS